MVLQLKSPIFLHKNKAFLEEIVGGRIVDELGKMTTEEKVKK